MFPIPPNDAALDTGDVRLYVQSKKLARWSPIFKHVYGHPFKVRPIPGLIMMSEDLLALTVSDTPYDLDEFVRMVHDDLIYDERRRGPLKLSMVNAWLRLGHKYQVQPLVDMALEELQDFFPDNLNDWDRRPLPEANRSADPDPTDSRQEQTRSRNGAAAAASTQDRGPAYDPRRNAIEMANLFRQTSDASAHMLPAALYDCAQLDSRVLRKGAPRADGLGRCYVEVLPERYRATCLQLKEKLVEIERDALRRYAAMVGSKQRARCERWNVCQDAWTRLRADAEAVVGRATGDPLSFKLVDDHLDVGPFCGTCSRLLETRRKRLRSEAWTKVVESFADPEPESE